MSFHFKWEHPAEEVFVTGTFDNWGKSTKLDKVGTIHEKTVQLPKSDEKILYKFVADGDWKHDHTAKTETDHEGNVNNVLHPADITPASTASAALSSVAPGASTLAMAGEQDTSHLPGTFPITPAANDKQMFSVNPIPASEGAGNPVQLAAGESVPEPSTINDKSVTSGVHDDPELKSGAEESEKAFGVAPIPATGGIGNPVHLEPGEKVPEPSSITGNTLGSNVKLDKASYEKSDTGAPMLPAPLSPQSEREAAGGASIFGLGPQTTNMIPESSMPMGKDTPADISKENMGPTISSVAPQSTTSALAGLQPLESSRSPPAVVTESQQEAQVDPEASANPQALQEKSQLENELQSKVPEAPATSEAPGSTVDKGLSGTAAEGVPAVVADSQEQASADPEAAASPQAVQAKDQLESELQSKVPEAPATSESDAATAKDSGKGYAELAAGGLAAAGTAAAGAAFAMRNKVSDSTGKDPVSFLPQSVQDSINGMNSKVEHHEPADSEPLAQKSLQPENDATLPQQTAVGESVAVPAEEADHARDTVDHVPEQVATSQKEAGVDPEAAASSTAVHEKSAVESELLSKVPESDATGEPAPTDSAALSSTAPVTTSSGAPQLGDPTSGVAPLSMDEKPVEGSKELNAPAGEPAVPPTQKPTELTPPAADSRDVSPMSKPVSGAGGQTEPVVTTGVGSSKAPATATAGKPVGTPRRPGVENSTPQKRQSFIDRMKGTPDSQKSSGSDATSNKRKSFFGRIKDKLK